MEHTIANQYQIDHSVFSSPWKLGFVISSSSSSEFGICCFIGIWLVDGFAQRKRNSSGGIPEQ